MKILVLSDSHSGRSFMRLCIQKVKPNEIVHLGDYYDDALVIREENPQIPLHHVPGNCDAYRRPPHAVDILIEPIGGVRFYMTHGHKHGVKMGTERLIRDAREASVDAVLYGHTHIPDCRKEAGMWILNPGSCGSYDGTAGLIDVENGKIKKCQILKMSDLEEML